MDKRTRMNVAMAFDEKYVPYAYTTILSLLENNRESEVFLYVLQKDLSDASKECIIELCSSLGHYVEFIFVNADRFKDKVPTTNKWTIEVYFRLLMVELLPDDVNRIFYLDSDMIINKSLLELYLTDMDDYDLAACYDLCLDRTTREIFANTRHPIIANMFNDKTYVNAGMLLYNMKRLRNGYSFERYMAAIEELDHRVYAQDQDIINYLHHDTMKRVDPRKYNYPGYMVYYEKSGIHEAKETVAIIHYIGAKPWQGGNHIHYSTEAIWWEYAFRTPFAVELMKNYISETVIDTTIEVTLNKENQEKNMLEAENAQLKVSLKEAMDSVRKVIAMFSEKGE